MKVKFWGTRGSIPTPGGSTYKYGGNTACVEVRAGESLFILDAGSGIRDLGVSLQGEFGKSDIKGHIFFTHFHWDHIQGLPYFDPIYNPGNSFMMYSAFIDNDKLINIFEGQMGQVYFPVPFSHLAAIKEWHCLPDDGIAIENVLFEPIVLNHPGQSVGYKLTHDGKSLVYITDNELLPVGDLDKWAMEMHLRGYLDRIDLLVGDGQYSREEFRSRRGWGHSSVEDLLDIACQQKVKKLAVFHHDPLHNDQYIDDMIIDLQKKKTTDIEVFAAREGMAVRI